MVRLTLILLAAAATSVACRSAALERHEYTRPKMGTPFRLVLYAKDDERADAAAEAVFARIDELDGLLSDYDPGSELSLLFGAAPPGEPRPVSLDLWRVLLRAQEISARTDGAFDVTVGPLVQLWRRAARQEVLPPGDELRRARAAVGHARLRLHPGDRSVELGLPGMRLDLGGIAKGYALDEALALLADRGIHHALIDGGGDVAVSAPPPGRPGWIVAIPGGALELAHAAVATSGDRYRHAWIDGVRYSHIIDPSTGLGLTHGIEVTVLASDGTTADAMASALSVLEPERGLAMVEETPGLEARLRYGPIQGTVALARERESTGFARHQSAPRPPGGIRDRGE